MDGDRSGPCFTDVVVRSHIKGFTRSARTFLVSGVRVDVDAPQFEIIISLDANFNIRYVLDCCEVQIRANQFHHIKWFFSKCLNDLISKLNVRKEDALVRNSSLVIPLTDRLEVYYTIVLGYKTWWILEPHSLLPSKCIAYHLYSAWLHFHLLHTFRQDARYCDVDYPIQTPHLVAIKTMTGTNNACRQHGGPLFLRLNMPVTTSSPSVCLLRFSTHDHQYRLKLWP